VANSPAEKAGLKSGSANADGTLAAGGDVITAVDGKSVASVEDLPHISVPSRSEIKSVSPSCAMDRASPSR